MDLSLSLIAFFSAFVGQSTSSKPMLLGRTLVTSNTACVAVMVVLFSETTLYQ